MSWWTLPACQQDRQAFTQQATQKLPEMLGSKFGQRTQYDYQASFARAWGPLAPEHKMKAWKDKNGEAA